MNDWPAGLWPYKHTPECTETTIPSGLLLAHATTPGTWARLHILAGRLQLRDLARALVIELGPVRFFVAFCRLETDSASETISQPHH